jgi:hypothetical protein
LRIDRRPPFPPRRGQRGTAQPSEDPGHDEGPGPVRRPGPGPSTPVSAKRPGVGRSLTSKRSLIARRARGCGGRCRCRGLWPEGRPPPVWTVHPKRPVHPHRSGDRCGWRMPVSSTDTGTLSPGATSGRSPRWCPTELAPAWVGRTEVLPSRQRDLPVSDRPKPLRTTLDDEAPPVLSVGNADVPCGESTVRPHAFRVNHFVDDPQVVPSVCGLSPAPRRFSTAPCTLHPQGDIRGALSTS